ncbi:type VII secretion integral membrane protein EccD [Kribbella antibiotica]|uniref:Type VII secretion integral membrane protein EccD n=1 Tax=Kribbella antibiotica TaxID=190195 RepID=A0A4R4ZUD8_9ACTN|nr:type VII secretion integral membrane protein EccD [Kribbella antibiotica]TDD61784.1 type VII secretion integral membrane protein EccD [Kribbella antibiotica]
MNITGLVRVTIDTPERRLDLALPEQATVAEVLPGLLTRAGEDLADEGGWTLRRIDGTELGLGRTVGAHRVRDGEILYLVPRETDWPELEYDDLVDAVASGSRRLGAAWGPWYTRAAGLTGATVAILTACFTILRTGSPWSGPAVRMLLLASLLAAIGVLLARVAGDSGAGVVVGGLSLPTAFIGGALLFAGEESWPTLGAPQILAGSAALLLAGACCLVGVVDGAALFATGAALGVIGILSGWTGTAESLDGADVAAITAVALVAISPLFGSLAIRLGRVPMPILPRTTADLVRDDPQPPRTHVYGAVVRADDLLTGILTATGVVLVICEILLVAAGGRSATIATMLIAAACLIRARLYPIVKQRLTWLAAGLAAVVALLIGCLGAGLADPVPTVIPVTLLLACGSVVLGLRYARRPPNPYLSRAAELLEIVIMLTLVPVACGILGLYGVLRGWGG